MKCGDCVTNEKNCCKYCSKKAFCVDYCNECETESLLAKMEQEEKDA